MVVHAVLDRFQQRGLAVVAAADDQGDASGYAHAGEAARMGRLDRDAQRLGRAEGLGVGHRTLGDARLARQDGAVGDEGDQIALAELVADGLLVVSEVDDRLELAFGIAHGEQRIADDARQRGEEHLLELARGDGALARGERRLEAHGDAFAVDRAGGAFDHLGSGAADAEGAAFDEVGEIERVLRELLAERAQDMVLQRDAAVRGGVEALVESGHVLGYSDGDLRRRREGIALNVADGQLVAVEGVGSLQIAVSGEALAGDALERAFQQLAVALLRAALRVPSETALAVVASAIDMQALARRVVETALAEGFAAARSAISERLAAAGAARVEAVVAGSTVEALCASIAVAVLAVGLAVALPVGLAVAAVVVFAAPALAEGLAAASAVSAVVARAFRVAARMAPVAAEVARIVAEVSAHCRSSYRRLKASHRRLLGEIIAAD